VATSRGGDIRRSVTGRVGRVGIQAIPCGVDPGLPEGCFHSLRTQQRAYEEKRARSSRFLENKSPVLTTPALASTN
jgi:hypothetical protein